MMTDEAAIEGPAETASPTVELAPGTALLVWQGVAITVPAEVEDLDPDVIEAFENDKAITAVRSIFGSDEYDRIRNEWAKRHDGKRPKMRDMGDLFDSIAKHFGFTAAGE